MKFLVMHWRPVSGPEIVPVAVSALETLNRKLGLGISLETVDIGFASLEKSGNTFPDEALEKARDADGTIMGPTDTLAYPPSRRVVAGRLPSCEPASIYMPTFVRQKHAPVYLPQSKIWTSFSHEKIRKDSTLTVRCIWVTVR